MRACALVRSLLLVITMSGLGDTMEDVQTCASGLCADGLVEAAAERAALCKLPQCTGGVVVGFANMGYSKFALNWVLSLRLAGLENYLIIALDERSFGYFQKKKVPAFYHPSLGASPTDPLHHQSGHFRDIMNLRLRATIQMLRGGVDVWLTDVDAVFNSDPFQHVDRSNAAMLAYDTPFLPKSANSPLMVMAGFFFMQRCSLHPENCELLEATLEHQFAHPEKHDQFAFNTVLSQRSGFKYGLLDPLLFCNGALYFGERAPQMLGVKAVVVQNNHITGADAKRHRFREHLLWFLDPPGYYSNASERYLLYENVQAPELGIKLEVAALENAFWLAKLLGRTLILPLFCLYTAVPGVYAGSADWCTAEEYFSLDPAVLKFKEHSFLLNPQTPDALKSRAESAPKHRIFEGGAGDGSRAEPGQFVPADPAAGATAEELRRWFAAPAMASEPLLVLGAMPRAMQKGADAVAEEAAREWAEGFRYREEVTRHVTGVVEQLQRPFTCLVAWEGLEGVGVGEMDGEMTEEELGELLEAVIGRVDAGHGLYLAVDGITSAHLEAFQVLFPHAAGFSLFPWLNQGFRRHQQTLVIHEEVCKNAESVIADLGGTASKEICRSWERDGVGRETPRVCTDLYA